MRLIEQNEIISITQARGVREIEMCKKLYHILNGDAWRLRIAEFVATATYQLFYGGLDPRGLETAIRDERGLNVWKNKGAVPTAGGLRNLCKYWKLLDAGDCSDLIRLFGRVVEEVQLRGSLSELDQKRLDRREGGDAFWGPSRARDRSGTGKANLEGAHLVKGRYAMLKRRRLGVTSFSGMSSTRLKRESTVRKIDGAFGLPAGCDISGTTADSIFFVSLMAEFVGGEVLASMGISEQDVSTIQLLPVATMGSQAHHTVLECALTRTLNGIMKDQIGYYDTLVPTGGCANAIENLLQEARRDSWKANSNILCFLDNGKLRAYQMRTDIEKHMFRNVAQLGYTQVLVWKAILPLTKRKAEQRLQAVRLRPEEAE